MKTNPPIIPKYIQVIPKEPLGMKKAPIVIPMRIKYLIAQKPFWSPALGSFEVLTPIMRAAIAVKKMVTAKQTR